MAVLERAGEPRIHYEFDDFTDPWRNAPVLMLQHGYSRSARIWYPWVPYLARHFRVLRMDLRGLGKSDHDFDFTTGMTVPKMIGDILAVIDAVGGGPVHYCGESLGGILGLVLAAEHPDRLRSLSLVSTPLSLSDRTKKDFSCGYSSWQEALRVLGAEEWSARMNSLTRFPPGSDPAMLAWYAKETGKPDIGSMIAMAGLATSVDVQSYLPRIKAPTLGLYPMEGPITVKDDEIIRKSVRDVRFIKLPTPYHAIQFFMPAACATEVLHFASQVDGVACHE